MQKRFHQHIQKTFPFLMENKFLIAISGGVDSVVLAYLCQRENLDFAFAHCNYQLRGEDSDQDEKFVRNLAKEFGVEVFVKRFETKKLVGSQEKSIQLLARELRYNWFQKLIKETAYTYVLTAHHLNDNVETFFINTIRGTGLEGLTGIPEINQKIIRPLLQFSRQEIQDYAEKNDIDWREDASNSSDDYLRNRIRHHIVPFLEKENPDFLSAFSLTQNHLENSSTLIQDYCHHLKAEISFQKEGKTYFKIDKLKKIPHLNLVIYHLFSPYGFKAFDDILSLLEAQSGKQVFSKNYRLLKDRDELILAKKQNKTEQVITINEDENVIDFPKGKIICEKVVKMDCADNGMGYIAENKIKYPLQLRPWRSGDTFRPLGMKGHKKISDFLKDLKLSLFEKENIWVLLSEEKIVWVVGLRVDEAFKIEKDTKDILKLQLLV